MSIKNLTNKIAGRYKHFKGNEYIVAGIAKKSDEPIGRKGNTVARYSEDKDLLLIIKYDSKTGSYKYYTRNDRITGDLVIYADPNFKTKWARPIDSFFSRVILADSIILDRFRLIG